MDGLSTLQEGSTTADAELIGIRTGYDSTNYSSAGKAVREQISELHENQNKLHPFYEMICLLIITGYWQNSGNQYSWVTDENYRPITVFNAWIADGVHPHSSPTDKPLKRIADVIGNWLIKI